MREISGLAKFGYFCVGLFGGLFGVWGMIIGVPAVAAIRMLLLDYLDDGRLNGSKKATEEREKTPGKVQENNKMNGDETE